MSDTKLVNRVDSFGCLVSNLRPTKKNQQL